MGKTMRPLKLMTFGVEVLYLVHLVMPEMVDLCAIRRYLRMLLPVKTKSVPHRVPHQRLVLRIFPLFNKRSTPPTSRRHGIIYVRTSLAAAVLLGFYTLILP